MKPKNTTMKTIISIVCLATASQVCLAQDYQAKINSVTQNGLHQILLSPQIISASQNNTNHIRIFDAKNNEVPYVISRLGGADVNYHSFPILSKESISNALTTVIISNENGIKWNGIFLRIANTDLRKTYSISGSNNQKEWYGLVNNQIIDNLKDEGSTSAERYFEFPVNNYKFLKFDFVDKNSLPINVLSAGLENSISKANPSIVLDHFQQTITNDKKNKQTQINIRFNHPELVDRIKFDISAPNYYKRTAKILVDKTRNIKKRKESYQDEVASFVLDSKSSNQFELSPLFEKQFTVVIDNEDNPPLEIKSISLSQNSEFIIADLKSGQSYLLKIDNNLETPNYDLAQSGIDLQANYPQAKISNLMKISKQDREEGEISFWQTSTFMWICIVLAVLILGYFSVSMVKDMNKDDE